MEKYIKLWNGVEMPILGYVVFTNYELKLRIYHKLILCNA